MPTSESAWPAERLGAVHDTADKASRIRRMFNGIAPRYELINSLFSVGRDAVWRQKAVELAVTDRHDDVLDLACGTGNFARAFVRAGAKSVVGCDFSHEMLKRAVGAGSRGDRPGTGKRSDYQAQLARGNIAESAGEQICRSRPLHWCEADALRLPFRSDRFSITSCAFGVRNFADLDLGLTEMFRVLRPGGRAVILEFTRPGNRVARSLYELYASRFMPLAATLISGDRSGAYRYLPRSVVSFPDAEQMCTRLKRAGFGCTTATPLTMGIVTVFVATRE